MFRLIWLHGVEAYSTVYLTSLEGVRIAELYDLWCRKLVLVFYVPSALHRPLGFINITGRMDDIIQVCVYLTYCFRAQRGKRGPRGLETGTAKPTGQTPSSSGQEVFAFVTMVSRKEPTIFSRAAL